jgi:hypothetical protein
LCFVTLPARGDVELDLLAFAQRLVAVALNIRIVDEQIFALVAGDEDEALLRDQELHSSSSHYVISLLNS